MRSERKPPVSIVFQLCLMICALLSISILRHFHLARLYVSDSVFCDAPFAQYVCLSVCVCDCDAWGVEPCIVFGYARPCQTHAILATLLVFRDALICVALCGVLQ